VFYQIKSIIKHINSDNFKKFADALRVEPVDQIVKNIFKFFKTELHQKQIRESLIEYNIEELFLWDNQTIKLTGWLVSKKPIKSFKFYISEKDFFDIDIKIERGDVKSEFPDYVGNKGQGFVHKIKLSNAEVELLKLNENIKFEIVDFYDKKFQFTEAIQKSSDNPSNINQLISFLKAKNTQPIRLKNKVDVVIPVYNGYEFLNKLFYSIEKNTINAYNLIVVNDASTDKRVDTFLKKKEKELANLRLINNSKNLGFVKSVNKAVEFTENHFILLNTDVEVPFNWLGKLIEPMISNTTIASTTPFTNAGTICSFPIINEDNAIISESDINTINESFSIDNLPILSEIPTGVGFCMGVNKDVVNQIGFFDEESFGKGYGEENDWCRRAAKIGFKNCIITNLYVFHHHGGSFLPKEKNALIAKNLKTLSNKHADYNKIVWSYINEDPLAEHRKAKLFRIMNALSSGVVLLFDHDNGGGANIYRKKEISKWVQQNKLVLKVIYKKSEEELSINTLFRNYKLSIKFVDLNSLRELVLLTKIEKIFVNELVGFPNTDEWLKFIVNLKETTKKELHFAVHDFHAICPSYTLLDSNENYCDVPKDITGKCIDCVKSIKHIEVDSVDIVNWRIAWYNFLNNCDEIICFSNSSKKILAKAYPTLKNETKVVVIPHKLSNIRKDLNTHKNGKLNIGILGAINLQKGSKVIIELSKWIEKNEVPAELIVLGVLHHNNVLISTDNYRNLKVTGKYVNVELPNLVEENNINVFFIPSIWPETFSYTTEEVMNMNMPIGVYNIGAPAERVRKYNKGHIFELNDNLEKIYTTLNELAENKDVSSNFDLN